MTHAAIRVCVYLSEGDEWKGRPLHLEILRMLSRKGVAGGTVLHAVAGFTGRGAVETTSLVDAGGKLPLVIEFIDRPTNIEAVMGTLLEMAGHRLIVREPVEVVSGLQSEE